MRGPAGGRHLEHPGRRTARRLVVRRVHPTIGADDGFHADFGSGQYEGGPIGIPYVVVAGDQAPVDVSFLYADESDQLPYPVPADAPIEGGPDGNGDRHVLVVDSDDCVLYELFNAFPQDDGSWQAGSGAVFDLTSSALRPDTWTSADAAGLPILPGLVRYDEVAAGEIRHALRFTASQTRQDYVWPARHYASDEQSPDSHRWVSGSASAPTSTSQASRRMFRSSSAPSRRTG